MYEDLLVVDFLNGEASLTMLVSEAANRGNLGSGAWGSDRRSSGIRNEGRSIRVDLTNLLRLRSLNGLPLFDDFTLHDSRLGRSSRCLRHLDTVLLCE